MTAGKTGQRGAQEIGCDGGYRPDDNASHLRLRHLLNFGTRLADLAENLSGLGKKCFSEIGEPGKTREPIKEPGAEFVLELANLLRERGLCDVLLFGGARKVSGASDRTEISQLMQFHPVS